MGHVLLFNWCKQSSTVVGRNLAVVNLEGKIPQHNQVRSPIYVAQRTSRVCVPLPNDVLECWAHAHPIYPENTRGFSTCIYAALSSAIHFSEGKLQNLDLGDHSQTPYFSGDLRGTSVLE